MKHRRRHTGEKPYACNHEDCGKRFATLATLKNHVRVHSDRLGFVCDACPKSFAKKKELEEHMARLHREGLECAMCDKVFLNASSLRAHRRTHLQEKADRNRAEGDEDDLIRLEGNGESFIITLK